MELSPALDEVAARFASACEQCGVEYAIIGGVAAGAHASGLETKDVAGVVALEPGDADRIEALLHALQARGFRVNVEAIRRRAARGQSILFLWIGLVRLDVTLQRRDGYWADALRFRQRARVGPRELWVAAAEDVVALKLAAGRPKDVEAVRNILRRRRNRLDIPRLRALAEKLSAKVADLPARLEALLREADDLNRLADLPPDT